MESIVIDTDIIIDHSQGKSSTLSDYLLLQDKKEIQLIVSAITLYEFFSGYSLTEQNQLEIANVLFSKIKIQEINEDISHIGARINREKKLHRKITTPDMLIASTCLYLGAKLLTRNKKHYQPIPSLKFAMVQ